MNSPNMVVPLYFGPAHKRLFGCYHDAEIGKTRNCGVLVCQPMGHEYIYCHRALRQLATRLAEAGFPVLRFDFYGCGDSYGDLEDGKISQWLQDISLAIEELKNKAGVTHICLMGIRLGAALSFIAAAQRGDIDTLVLWDPVVIGKVYLDELCCLQKEALRCRPKPIVKTNLDYTEVIGFPLSPGLRAELETLNLLTIIPRPSTTILGVQSDQSTDNSCLKDHLGCHTIRFDYEHIQAPKIWLPTVDGSLLVPNQILRSVISWTSRTQA